MLAGESFEEIARKCQIQREVVSVYHEIFYCVRHMLDASIAVLNRAIDAKVHENLAEDDVDLLLKLYGHLRGPVFLDTLVDYFKNPPVVPERSSNS